MKPATTLAGPRMASQGLAEPLTCHPVIDTHTFIGSSASVGAYPEHATRLVSGTTGLLDHDHSIGPDACEDVCPIDSDPAWVQDRELWSRSPIRHTGRCNQRSRHLSRWRVGLNRADLHEERSRNRGNRAHPGEDGSANELDLVIVDAELVGCDPQQSDGAIFLVCWGRTNLALPILTTACDYPIHGSMGPVRHE
jgi:hypothetical protein